MAIRSSLQKQSLAVYGAAGLLHLHPGFLLLHWGGIHPISHTEKYKSSQMCLINPSFMYFCAAHIFLATWHRRKLG